MKHALLSTLFAFITFLSFGQTADEKAVLASFDAYKEAILASDGKEAVTHVDQNTLAYYSEMLELSISADSSTVDGLGLMDKLMVMTVRHRVPAEEVREMSGRAFFIYAVDEGMVGKNSVMNLEIGEVNIDGNSANGAVVSNGQPAPFGFDFHKENDSWKIDLTSIFGISETAITQMITQQGMTDTEWIFMALEMMTQKKPQPSIWQPIR